MGRKCFIWGLRLLVVGLTGSALLWLVKMPPSKDFFPPGGVLYRSEATPVSTGEVSLSDSEWLSMVDDGRRHPNHVPTHLTCQAWMKLLERKYISSDDFRDVPVLCLSDDFMRRAIERDPFVVWHMLDERLNEEWFMLALESWSSKDKGNGDPRSDISRVITKSFWTRPLIDRYFAVGGWSLANIPAELIDWEVAILGVNRDGRNLQYIPAHALVNDNGPQSIWQAAVAENPLSLEFVPWEERRANGCALSWLALEKSNAALPYVPAICFRGLIPPS